MGSPSKIVCCWRGWREWHGWRESVRDDIPYSKVSQKSRRVVQWVLFSLVYSKLLIPHNYSYLLIFYVSWLYSKPKCVVIVPQCIGIVKHSSPSLRDVTRFLRPFFLQHGYSVTLICYSAASISASACPRELTMHASYKISFHRLQTPVLVGAEERLLCKRTPSSSASTNHHSPMRYSLYFAKYKLKLQLERS